MERLVVRLVISLVVALVGLAPSLARASSFEVNPVRLTLTPTATSGLLTVRNRSLEPVRLQVVAYAWSQSRTGEIQLAPTQDLVFFPAMVTIAAGASRKVRVGASVAFATAEKSYRIFLEELPPLSTPETPGVVRVLTRMGIPVFLEPAGARSTPRIDGLAITGHVVSFDLKDVGNAHFLAKKVAVVGRDAGGAVVFQQDVPGWYVLNGTARSYRVDVPSAACRSIATLAVNLSTDTRPAAATLPSARCVP
jgi:fimbrial chaperone protein